MTFQLESRHFFRAGDTVQHLSGPLGEVAEAHTLYAIIRWMDGRQQEVEQFDSEILVLERATPPS